MVLSDLDECYWVICLDENTQFIAKGNSQSLKIGVRSITYFRETYPSSVDEMKYNTDAKWKSIQDQPLYFGMSNYSVRTQFIVSEKQLTYL
jgi:hypothetical protein